MTTAITIHQERTITPAIWQMIGDMAPVIYGSRLFMRAATSKEAAAAIMLKGYELGLPFTAAFDFIQMIEGKLELSPRGAMALLHDAPQIADVKVVRLANGVGGFVGYECTMKRKNGFTHTSRFTLEDAKKAGLLKPNGNWEKYPENMCMWRAIGFCADVVAPDVTAGMTGLMKMPEAYGVALDEGGNVVESTAVEVKNEPVSATTVTLSDLLEHYSPDAIMAANGGAIPGTDDELALVAAKLAGEK